MGSGFDSKFPEVDFMSVVDRDSRGNSLAEVSTMFRVSEVREDSTAASELLPASLDCSSSFRSDFKRSCVMDSGLRSTPGELSSPGTDGSAGSCVVGDCVLCTSVWTSSLWTRSAEGGKESGEISFAPDKAAGGGGETRGDGSRAVDEGVSFAARSASPDASGGELVAASFLSWS